MEEQLMTLSSVLRTPAAHDLATPAEDRGKRPRSLGFFVFSRNPLPQAKIAKPSQACDGQCDRIEYRLRTWF